MVFYVTTFTMIHHRLFIEDRKLLFVRYFDANENNLVFSKVEFNSIC